MCRPALRLVPRRGTRSGRDSENGDDLRSLSSVSRAIFEAVRWSLPRRRRGPCPHAADQQIGLFHCSVAAKRLSIVNRLVSIDTADSLSTRSRSANRPFLCSVVGQTLSILDSPSSIRSALSLSTRPAFGGTNSEI